MAQEDAKRSDLPQAQSSPRPPERPERSYAAAPSERPRFRISWWWIAIALALLAVNY